MANKGTFTKGDKRAGRPKGATNVVTRELKEMILGALDAVGGQKYLEKQAEEKPEAFIPLLGKCLPKDVNLGGGLRLNVNLYRDGRRTDN